MFIIQETHGKYEAQNFLPYVLHPGLIFHDILSINDTTK